ncbi:MAG: hypothetical protein NVS9B10_02940 [Nevskia sp.]
MKAKKEGESIAKPRSARRRAQEPLEVKLSLRYRFGDEPGDTVTMMDDRAIPMVESVFKNRDKILRGLAMTLIRAGASQPKVLSEMVPALKLLPGAKRKSNPGKK